jgi:hypothetical protein
MIDKIKRKLNKIIFVGDDIDVNVDNERHRDRRNDVRNIKIFENKFGNNRVKKKSMI